MQKKLVLIISGHPSKESLSQEIIKVIDTSINAHFYDVKIYNAFDFPLVGDFVKNGLPKEFDPVAEDISRADAVFVVGPMWNFNITGALKNFLDGAIQSRKHFHFTKLPLKQMVQTYLHVEKNTLSFLVMPFVQT